ncbi:hypothetical protein LAZ40_07415 [Cereibacter sphaeroides]|uniref:hypothetical protein n=1 Tax=Rhodobacterales TaxID=204455 RepID=UPI000BBF1499|nr:MULTISPECIES: hypothetical protein [Paracoccaceae]MCE6951196.1 hypothetical protein [Cereibacter sphaeroides]MCE6958875.1 hypothetical protein [Cereibacter sphaeroides]MCE6968894.1 hypothetical protein [Cereibacter sphaeroides]MCE6973513.1 hypothetical protein [Cereibacter sphaeroides]
MRDFLISTYDKLVMTLVILIAVGAVIGAIGMMSEAGVFAGLLFLLSGLLSAVIFGGSMFLLIGIYENSKRIAALLEARR